MELVATAEMATGNRDWMASGILLCSLLNANERKRVLNILESNWQAEMHG
jgi:hypothetical protein